ncbi:MAG: transglycosylase family protein [Candidatus Limnocylindria bacterium]
MLVRRILLLALVSVSGIALLAPLAARSAIPAPVDVPERLLPAPNAPGPALDRGGLSARGATTLSRLVAPTAEALDEEAPLPTPATASMQATLFSVATPTAPAQAPQRIVRYDGDSVWDDLAQCESGGNWAINTGNGYFGGLQFSLGTWQQYGGTQYAAYPHEATREQQIATAERLHAARGYAPWPACRASLGLP